MKKKTGHTILESPDLVAFISLVKNIQPHPFIRELDRRVCFSFDAEVLDAIQEFYRNVPVPIGDYCKILKSIRSMIFNLKGAAKNGK